MTSLSGVGESLRLFFINSITENKVSITMPNNFIPKTSVEISKKINDHIVAGEITAAFLMLKKKFRTVPNPIIIDDLKKPTHIKITRKIQGKLDLEKFEQKFPNLEFSFGEKLTQALQRAPQPAPNQNKGQLFEQNFADDISRWWNGQRISSVENKQFIDDMSKFIGFAEWEKMRIKKTGSANNPRPLIINGDSVLIDPGLNNSIGETISDITLYKGSSTVGVYLSLKFSKRVALFNTGTKKYLTDAELQSGLIKNPEGLSLINMFGINNGDFCAVFNGSVSKSYYRDTTNSIDRSILENMIKSGIGYGYHMIHKIGKKFIHTEVDRAYRDSASHVISVVVYYGGKIGMSQRVDIDVFTSKYLLKFNFRNKRAGRYISHLTCDYQYI